MTDYTDRDKILRDGQAAERLLNEPFLMEVLDSMVQGALDQLFSLPSFEEKKAQAWYHHAKAASQVKSILEHKLMEAKQLQEQIEQKEQNGWYE